MSFGINLKKARTENGYTQEQLAEKLGVSRQSVSLWESDSGYPEVEKLLDISEILNISLDWLFFDRENTKIKTLSSDGKITIHSPTENAVVRCDKVAASQQFKGKKNEPEYALFAADKGNSYFNGENRTIIGWYRTKEDIAKETEEIYKAISDGENNYTLKYAVNVNRKGLVMQITE
ncbi:MAG: helix-turn-helix transcriptional regulator [Oscillospiraceae bacterium]|nr:helix-turn-helix transcriptional regulator [Oscillospiraceae bacterium]MBQ6850228.1 helix-turn-helix transcriptional regulator [Oscillospiraceae bacterium]